MTTRPETVTLPHTDLQVPAEHSRVVTRPLPASAARNQSPPESASPTARSAPSRPRATERCSTNQPAASPSATTGSTGSPLPASSADGLFPRTLLVKECDVAVHLLRALANNQTLARYVIYGHTDHVVRVKLAVPIRDLDLTNLVNDLAQVAEKDGGR
jgi:hypothetical protein